MINRMSLAYRKRQIQTCKRHMVISMIVFIGSIWLFIAMANRLYYVHGVTWSYTDPLDWIMVIACMGVPAWFMVVSVIWHNVHADRLSDLDGMG